MTKSLSNNDIKYYYLGKILGSLEATRDHFNSLEMINSRDHISETIKTCKELINIISKEDGLGLYFPNPDLFQERS